MSILIKGDKDYSAFIRDIKSKIQTAQIKASVSVNRELLQLYWEIAELIVEKQKNATWGDGFLVQMSGFKRRVSPYEGFFPSEPEIYAPMVSVLESKFSNWATACCPIGKQATSCCPNPLGP